MKILLSTVLIILFLITGYVINFVKFVKLDFKTPYKAEVIRGIGVLSGIGAIVGWINIKDN